MRPLRTLFLSLALAIGSLATSFAQQTQTVFQYMGGLQPSEMTVLDAKAANDVEFGVPRSRLFDNNSPLAGSMADNMEFPGPDDSMQTGMLVKTGAFSDSGSNFVTLCIRVTITRTSTSLKFLKCKIVRAGGFMLSPQAQMVVNAGGRGNWARIIRRLAKLETERNPRNANRIDRLRRRVQRKADKDAGYQTLLDGTHYMPDLCEETISIEFTTTSETFELVFYLTFSDKNNFDSHGVFIPQMELSLTDEPGDGANMGSIEDNALVVDLVDVSTDQSVPVIAYDGGNMLLGLPPTPIDPDLGVIFANASPNDTLVVGLVGYPDAMILPRDSQPQNPFEASYILLDPNDTLFGFAFVPRGTFQQEFMLITGFSTNLTGPLAELIHPKVYPNPAYAWSHIKYELPRAMLTQVQIFDLQGRLVRNLARGYQAAGAYQVNWNGRDELGSMLPPGLYLYRLRAGPEIFTGKILRI